jgi:hypothetical protein
MLHPFAKKALPATREHLVIIYTILKTNQPFDEHKFQQGQDVTDQICVKRMVNELTRLGYAVSYTQITKR